MDPTFERIFGERRANLLEVQTRQLEHGGIVDLFERRFSADGVKHHKPSPLVPRSSV